MQTALRLPSDLQFDTLRTPQQSKSMPSMNLVEKWWPKAPEQAEWSEKLDQFYANSSQYHEMTSAGRALEQPQVQLLMAFLDQDQSYAEVGCGGA